MANFDFFISYNWGIQSKVKVLYNFIANVKGYSSWRDENQMKPSDWLYDEIARGITNSKVIITCITKAYSLSDNCKREISFAVDQKKPIIALMFENVTLAELGGVGVIIAPLLRIYLFENKNSIIREFTEIEINNAVFPALQSLMQQHATQNTSSSIVEVAFLLINFIKLSQLFLFFCYF